MDSAPPFRFATLSMPGNRAAVVEHAQWAEAAGFHAVVTADHLINLAPGSTRFAQAFSYDQDLSVDDVLGSPFLAFGTEAEIAEHFKRVREELGISYWTLTPRIAEPFLPVLEELLS